MGPELAIAAPDLASAGQDLPIVGLAGLGTNSKIDMFFSAYKSPKI